VVTAVPASHAAASVREVFLAVVAVVADSQAAVAPVADRQAQPDVAVMIKEQAAVAPEELHLPAV
jgi:hypothetical protein